MQQQRTLFVLPIVHNEADLGSAAAAVRSQFDAATWAARQNAIEAWWDVAQNWVRESARQWGGLAGVNIYQDGLPVDAPVSRIIEQLAAAGSRNHQLLAEMSTLGGTVLGTESPELLLREVQLVKASGPRDPRTEQRARSLLEQRDRFIGERIAATLPPGGRGILLIGVAHHVEAMLPADIQTIRPVKSMPGMSMRQAG